MVHYENHRFCMSELEDLLETVQLNPHKGKDMSLQISELVLESIVFCIPLKYTSKFGIFLCLFVCVCVCVCVCISVNIFPVWGSYQFG